MVEGLPLDGLGLDMFLSLSASMDDRCLMSASMSQRMRSWDESQV